MYNPLVSIIIPVYNREDLLAETLESVLVQSYKNWECIIVDDGSIDGTVKVAEQYQNRDSRFRLIKRERLPKGAPTCRNIGYNHAKGEFINWFDSDDKMDPHMLDEKIDCFKEFPQYGIVVCQSRVVELGTNKVIEDCISLISDNALEDFVEYKLRFFVGGPMFKKSLLETMSFLFNEGQKKHQETEFYFRVLWKEKKFKLIEKPLIDVRIHNYSISKTVSWQDDISIIIRIVVDRYYMVTSSEDVPLGLRKILTKQLIRNIRYYFLLDKPNQFDREYLKNTIKALCFEKKFFFIIFLLIYNYFRRLIKKVIKST